MNQAVRAGEAGGEIGGGRDTMRSEERNETGGEGGAAFGIEVEDRETWPAPIFRAA